MKKINTSSIPRLALAVCGFILLLTTETFSQPLQPVKSGYAPVNGLKMYYEVHGEGSPMILLHGAYQSIDKMFREVILEYSKTRKIIAIEFQGHGRTSDIERDITYENLASDVNQLLQQLALDSVDIFAFSMGSSVALQFAIKYPGKVKKMVLLSGAYSDKGYQPSYIPIVPNITPAMFEGSSFKKDYDSLSPHPNRFPLLVQRLKKLDMTHFDWEKDYKNIKKPTFLIFGDNDLVTLEHINAMVTKLGGNVMGDMAPAPKVRLAIIPNTSHVGMMTRHKLINHLIAEFLTE